MTSLINELELDEKLQKAVLQTSRIGGDGNTSHNIPIKCFPTPSTSMRYMISIPITHSKDSNHDLMQVLGFDIKPILHSSNPGRSIGAKISTFVDNSFHKQYNLRCGDELYKINQELVRMSSFSKIQQRLDELVRLGTGTISITFERGSTSCPSLHHPKPESILKIHNKVQSTEPKRVIFENQPDIDLYPHDTPKDRTTDSDCSGDVLHSIFSPSVQGTNKTVYDDDNNSQSTLSHHSSLETKNQSSFHPIADIPCPSLAPPQDQPCYMKDHGRFNQTQLFSYSSTLTPVGLDHIEDTFHQIKDDCISFGSQLNETDYWSYSTASSPVGLDIMEETMSKRSEGKSYFSSPGSSVIPKDTLLRGRDCSRNPTNGIPTVVYRNSPQSIVDMDDGSISTEYWSPREETTSCQTSIHEDLKRKLGYMRKTVKALEQQIVHQAQEAKRKISSIESAKALADKEIIRLQSICVSSSKEAKEIRIQLDSTRNLVAELCAELKNANYECETLSLENKQLSSKIQELETRLQNESKQSPIIFGDIVRELAAAEAAASAIAKALVQSETELALSLEAQEKQEKVIDMIRKESTSLQSQNMELEDRFLLLSHELKKSNALVDKLSEELKGNLNHTDAAWKIKMEWSTAKLSYENQIQALKRSIEKYSTFIPLDEYSRVKNESERNSLTLASKVQEIKTLNGKIEDLENRLKRLKESQQIPVVVSPSLSAGDDSSPNYTNNHVCHEVTDSDTFPVIAESESPQQLTQNSSNILKFSSLTRREIIRAAGGHTALNERLKKARSAIIRSKESVNESSQIASPVFLHPFRSPLASIQGNGRTLALRLASSHGKENISCQ